MAKEIKLIVDFELKEDLEDSIQNNQDIKADEAIVAQLMEIKSGAMLQVEKTIGSNVIIKSIKEVNKELLSSAFS